MYCEMPRASNILHRAELCLSILHCCIVCTHSFFLSLISASFYLASFDLCPVPPAHSSFESKVCTSFTAASFVLDLYSMLNAHSSLDNPVCAFFATASLVFNFCPVPYAHSSFDDLIGASIRRAFISVHLSGHLLHGPIILQRVLSPLSLQSTFAFLTKQ